MFDPRSISIASEVLALARERGLKLTTAESCTGGLIAGALTEIAGSSDVFDRGFVTYSNAAKMQMLDVSDISLQQFGAVSDSVAKEMAFGAIANSDADIAVSVTGIAGPDGGTTEKPVGLVWFGIHAQGQIPTAEKKIFTANGRSYVRKRTVVHALTLLKSTILTYA